MKPLKLETYFRKLAEAQGEHLDLLNTPKKSRKQINRMDTVRKRIARIRTTLVTYTAQAGSA